MNQRISCLIIEQEPEAIRHIDVLGRKMGTVDVRWKTNSLETGIGILRKHLPEMAIVGLGPDPASTIESISGISREFPSVFLLVLSASSDADLILRTMRAGASDFLCKPVKEADLRAVVEKAIKFRSVRKEDPAGAGKVLSVFSNKGGNGTTTIAVNLADALVRYQGKKVAVVDLVLAHGDVTMFYNIHPSYSILDLARNADKADYDFLHTLLVKHQSGVYVLADPPMIEDAEQISGAQVRQVLATLKSMFDVIVVDTPHQFDERTLTALECSDIVLVVSLLNLPSLKNTQKCLELFERIGLRDERLKLVVSRYLPSDEITKESVERILNCPVFFAVPNDYSTVISSINRGRLLAEVAPGKEVTRSFQAMSRRLFGGEAQAAASNPGRKPGWFQRIFSGERRTTR